MRRAQRALAGLVAVAALVAFAPTTLARVKLPTLLGNSPQGPTKLQVRPAQIIYTQDGSGILGGSTGGSGKGFGRLVWTTWTTRSAQGHGADWIDNCMPNCASGRFFANTATVTASRPRHGHFTVLTLQSSYRGKPFTSRWKLVRLGGNLTYNFDGS